MTKHIICYSGGHSSALVAIEVVRKYGKENVTLLNHDIHPSVESSDIKRFKDEVAAYLGLPITYANHPEWDKKDQFDIVVDAKAFKVGNGTALCTNRLKTAPFEKWLKESVPDKNCICYYGFDANELVRVQRRSQIMGSMGYKTDYPLALWNERTITSTKEIGIEPPNTYGVFKHANCFSGDTKFITREGSVTLEQTVGKSVEVITRDGWKKADIKHFGNQQIVELTLSNGSRTKTLKTTENHRWIVPKHNHKSFGYVEKTTSALMVGDRIPTVYSVTDVSPDFTGIQHGFTFGDGSLYKTSNYEDGKFKSRAYIANSKEQVLQFFTKPMTEKRCVHGLPAEFKVLPDIKLSDEYLLGFIIGLVSSDGCVGNSGITISNKDREVLEGIHQILNKLGIVSWVGDMKTRDTNYKKGAVLGNITIPRICFKREWLIRDFHKERFGEVFTEPKSWKVESIRKTDVYEDVYCAVVEGDFKEFTLDGNILTGNCTGCLKAGKQHWYIVYLTRPDLWEKAKAAEDAIGYSILKEKYLDELEADFERMKNMGIQTTEHEKGVTFFARVRKEFKDIEAEGDTKPCECTF